MVDIETKSQIMTQSQSNNIFTFLQSKSFKLNNSLQATGCSVDKCPSQGANTMEKKANWINDFNMLCDGMHYSHSHQCDSYGRVSNMHYLCICACKEGVFFFYQHRFYQTRSYKPCSTSGKQTKFFNSGTHAFREGLCVNNSSFWDSGGGGGVAALTGSLGCRLPCREPVKSWLLSDLLKLCCKVSEQNITAQIELYTGGQIQFRHSNACEARPHQSFMNDNRSI